MRWTYMERWMEAEYSGLERSMEDAAEAAKIDERGMKEAAAKTAAEAANSIYSSGTSSASTSASTAASAFTRDPNYTSCVVGVARRSGYT